ncbi:MAG: AI-2 transport protein TqsA [Bradymonadia bacterium]|jgi:AI-2 transport protein TqsA
MATTEPLLSAPISAPGRGVSWALVVLATIALLAALKAAAAVVIPTFLAIFVAILVRPPLQWLSRFMPRAIALVIVLSGLFGMLIGAWTFLSTSAGAIAESAPEYYTAFRELIDGGLAWAAARGLPISTELIGADKLFDFGMQALSASIAPIVTFFGSFTLVAFMLILLLLETDQLRGKLERGFGAYRAVSIARPLERVMSQFQRYFFTKTIISAVTGILTAAFTAAVGIDFPYVWGVLAFFLNFIPNVGSIIAVFPPVLLALVQFDNLSYAAFSLVGLTTIQVTIGNFIDPRVLGKSLALSPFFLFASMVFWGWMWGVVGIFLAVPLTVLLRMLFEQFAPLQPIAVMMSGLNREELEQRSVTMPLPTNRGSAET